MTNLTEEFCRKHDRPDSLLLTGTKGMKLSLFEEAVLHLKSFMYLAPI